MKILLVCMKYDYGDPNRGRSYEYVNFYQSLLDMGHAVEIFDYMGQTAVLGKAGMNRKLIEQAEAIRPDLMLFSLYTDQFDPAAIRRLKNIATTVCFFHDDTWRVEYSRFWAPHFDYFTTPNVHGEYLYRRLGLENAIHFPFGVNEIVYRKIDQQKKYEVSFVGAWHPYRQWLVDRLKKAGFSVNTAGFRWPQGIISHDEMVNVFNQSKICVNLSNCASWDVRYLLSSPRALLNRVRSPKVVEQLKARHFEINGCGAFQLSYYIDGLEKCYEIGREIAVYLDPDDLIAKVKWYLADDELRESMASAGYRRTLTEHTFKHRFERAFERMGLPG